MTPTNQMKQPRNHASAQRLEGSRDNHTSISPITPFPSPDDADTVCFRLLSRLLRRGVLPLLRDPLRDDAFLRLLRRDRAAISVLDGGVAQCEMPYCDYLLGEKNGKIQTYSRKHTEAETEQLMQRERMFTTFNGAAEWRSAWKSSHPTYAVEYTRHGGVSGGGERETDETHTLFTGDIGDTSTKDSMTRCVVPLSHTHIHTHTQGTLPHPSPPSVLVAQAQTHLPGVLCWLLMGWCTWTMLLLVISLNSGRCILQQTWHDMTGDGSVREKRWDGTHE
jgi:hypothetical protein